LKTFTVPVTFFPVTSPVNKTFAYLTLVLHAHSTICRYMFTVGFRYNFWWITAHFSAGRRQQLVVRDIRVLPYAQMHVWDALFGWKMEKGCKTARRMGPLGHTWFRMVVCYWLNLNLNRSAKNSFENKIRIWNICSVSLVHLSTPKSGKFTPLN